ncbi:TlpA family protein disulfide reductase [Candidatus Micrarchaeota archaeon]|nr:TlpA family protein disulfide reductase [Candidatus Micrarchaeota archaeon]
MKTILSIFLISLLLFGCISKEDSTKKNTEMFGGFAGDNNSINSSIPEPKNELPRNNTNIQPSPPNFASQYLPFEKSKYEEAKSSGKIIFLEFYANWCPICKAQAPEINAAFSDLTNPEIVGFRVNYNDDETDDYEKALAKEFGITYQHTHLVLDKNGNVAIKSLESWSKDKIKEELQKLT